MTESKKKWITVIVACIYSAYIVTYMRIRFNSFIWGVVSLCLFMVFTKKSNYTNKWEKFWNLIFAGILSITLIMGYHIVISQRAGAIYNGVKTENYITPYGFNDFVALIVLTHSGYFLLNELIHKLTKISLDNKFIGKERNIEKKPYLQNHDVSFAGMVTLFFVLLSRIYIWGFIECY